MPSFCPSPDPKKLRVGLYKCPLCGTEVQIFSDETGVKCHECGRMVSRSKVPVCIEWCALAQQCLGEEGRESLNSRLRRKKGGKDA